MFTFGKPSSGVFMGLRILASRVGYWWMSMSDQQQKDVRGRIVAAATCAFGVGISLPAVSLSYGERVADAEFRASAERFAEAPMARDSIDPVAASPLLDHPWMVAVEYALERDPRASLTRYGDLYRDAAALKGVASFDVRHTERAEGELAEQRCLAEAVYYEARSEGTRGQIAVAEVVMNRVRDHRYPDSVCGVVYQGSERTTGCQFTFTCDGALKHKPRGKAWDDAQIVATHVLLGFNTPMTGGATHYHTDYVDPVWNASLIETVEIGTHIFYRFPRGAEWALVRERQEKSVDRVMASQSGAGRSATVVPAASVKPAKPSVIKAAPPAP